MKNAVEICPTTAFGLTEQGVLLVDVREPQEFAEASFDVRNLMLIPFSQFEERYREIPSDRQVIIACNIGERSLMATYFLMNHGYEQAVNMQYGIVRWAEKGFPMKGELKRKTGGCCCGSSTGKTTGNNSTNCC
jgi:rhodanese-related sulfurtransferase